MKVDLIFPSKKDYPEDILSPKGVIGCGLAYYQTHPFIQRMFNKRIKKAIELIPKRRYKSTLDAGTGIGYLIPTISLFTRKIIAIDNSSIISAAKVMVEKRGIQNVIFYQCNVEKLPFGDETFDLIISLSVLEHVKEPKNVLEEYSRVLTRKGVLIIGYPVEDKLLRFFRKIDSIFFRSKIYKEARRKKTVGIGLANTFSTWKDIKNAANQVFKIDKMVNIKILFASVYQILRLVR